MGKRQLLESRFWSKVETSSLDKCWEWTASKFKDGYGKFKMNGKNKRAHRIAYLLTYYLDPGELQVCHLCDNPSCVNPQHLWLGTTQQNTKDRDNKGRAATGSETGHRKLSKEQVLEIRRLLKQGDLTHEKIAIKYNVSRPTISMIAEGKTWGWLS